VADYHRHFDVAHSLTDILHRVRHPSSGQTGRPAEPHQPGDDPTGAHPTGVLLRRASDGDPHAWGELVNRYTRMLWSIGRAHRLDTADAADAAQTTWLRLLENMHRVEDPDRLAGWLVTTMRRECLRIVRRAGRERAYPPDTAAFDAPDPTESVDAALIRADRDRQLWEAFNRMPDRCRLLLRVMITSPPPSYEAVAALLESPIGSIGPTRARCLSRLRAMLDQAEDLPPPRRQDRYGHPPNG
jgi:RNA polymerase sigma factor (sigma-70 family)